MILLQNGLVIDGISDEPLENHSVLIESGHIKAIAPANQMNVIESEMEVKVIECSGKTIMPGLIDAHTHLIYREFPDVASIRFHKSIEESALDAAVAARQLIHFGITTIREVGTRGNISVVVRDAIERGDIPGPKVFASGNVISTVGGLSDHFPTHVIPEPYGTGALIQGPDEARSVVRRMLKDGVDWIKVEASGTGANPMCPAERNTLSYEEVAAVVDQAGQNGVPVACHAESNTAIKKASKAGVRSIEHGIYLDGEALDMMLKNNIFYVPTKAMYWNFLKKGPVMGTPQAVIDNHKRTHEFHVRSIQMAMDAGICIVAGSDAGLAHFPQGGVRDEIESFVELGMRPMDAIKTATINAAKCLDIDGITGSLEEGKRADVIVIKKNPLENIAWIKDERNLATVIKNGEVIL